jgi:hypothetical protein
MRKVEEVKITFRYPDKTLAKYTFSLKEGMLEKVEKVFLEMVDQIEKIKREE